MSSLSSLSGFPSSDCNPIGVVDTVTDMRDLFDCADADGGVVCNLSTWESIMDNTKDVEVVGLGGMLVRPVGNGFVVLRVSYDGYETINVYSDYIEMLEDFKNDVIMTKDEHEVAMNV